MIQTKDNMSNRTKFLQSQADLITTLYDITGEIVESDDYKYIEENLILVDKLTTIIKRIGDTVVLEVVDNIPTSENNSSATPIIKSKKGEEIG